MGSLFTSLLNSTNGLQVYNQALQVVENNVTNANTPGYASQNISFMAQPFDMSVGLPGGVSAGPDQSTRSPYAEQNVRDQQTSLGYYSQKTSDLSQLSTYFDVTGKTGIGPAISGLFNSFSQLSINPNDTTTRQAVLQSATQFAQTIRDTAAGLATAQQQVGNEAQGTVSAINNLAQTIAQINTSHRIDPQGNVDPGIDAQLNNSLEQLSQYANFTALQQPDGTVSVYIGGQTPLVIGTEVQPIQTSTLSDQTSILNSSGQDITSQITGGQLSAQIEVQNTVIPSYVANLNTLAQSVADQVNTALQNGIDQNGNSPSTNLFYYDPTAGAASTIAVNSSVTPDQIAAALPGAPGGNGNALALAALGSAKVISGATFAQYYGNLGSQVGTDIANAQNGSDTHQQMLTQAQSLRSQISGVSLDEQATKLIQYQRSYQAISKMVTVLDDLTSTVINMIPATG